MYVKKKNDTLKFENDLVIFTNSQKLNRDTR